MFAQVNVAFNRPISVYRLGEMPIQSCGQSVSARRGKRYTEIGLFKSRAHWRIHLTLSHSPHLMKLRSPMGLADIARHVICRLTR